MPVKQLPKHDWSLPSSHGRIAVEDENEYADAANATAVLSVSDAEGLIESLLSFNIDEVGSSKWLRQHCHLVKLNLQAHQSAMARSDEYVLEAFQTFGKVNLIIRELLLIEAWKEFVLPELMEMTGIRTGENNMRIYFTLYHEAMLANLLETAMYRKHVCTEIGNVLIDLVDYCVRKIVLLNQTRKFSAEKNESKDVKEMAYQQEVCNSIEELMNQADEIEFRSCIAAISMLRFLCEFMDDLPLSVVSRILDTHDVLLGVIPLIENPPWTRRLDSGKWQKFIDFKWIEVRPADLLKLTRTEGQVWLMVYHLLTQPECRRRYHINSFRKSALLRIRRYINPILLDQLPVLADIQRFMDELTITEVPEPTQDVFGANVVMEQIPQVREKLIRKQDWKVIAESQVQSIFGKVKDSYDEDLKYIGLIYQEDSLEGILDPSSI